MSGESFVLSGAREMLTAERANELLAPLEKQPSSFTSIKLSGKSFNVEAAQAAASVLVTLDNLHTADLSDIIAGQHETVALEAIGILTQALSKACPGKIVTLDLSDNAFGLKGMRASRPVLEANKDSLKILRFNNNGLEADAANLLADVLLEGSEATNLEEFEMFNNLLEDGGARGIARLIQSSANLHHVRLSATRIQNEGGLAVAKACVAGGSSSFVSVDFSDNTFGGEAGEILAEFLGRQTGLKSLNLSGTGIQNEGGLALGKSLCSPGLEVLNLASNEIEEEESVESVANAVKKLSKLRVLRLEENEFGSTGTKHICRAVKRTRSLEELDFTFCDVTSSAVKYIVSAIANKPALKHVSFNGNMISSMGVDLIKEALERSSQEQALASMSDNDEDNDSEIEDASESEGEDEDATVDAIQSQMEKLST